MSCPRCGATTQPGTLFCPMCGTALNVPIQQQAPQYIPPSRPRKKSKDALIIAIVAVVVVVLVVVAALAIGWGGTSKANAGNSSGQYKLIISYGGSWTGAYYYDGSTISISGNGSKDIAIDKTSDSFQVFTANAQKQDDSSATLTLTLYDSNGDELKTASTETAYGLVSISYSG